MIYIKRITDIAILSTLLVVVDYVLAYIPNVQLVMLLMFLYVRNYKFSDVLIIITVYVVIDNMMYGGLGMYTIPMLVGWFVVAFTLRCWRSSCEVTTLALLSILTSILYAIPFAIMNWILYGTIYAYIIADIPFVIVMCVSSYLSIILLYERIDRRIK